MGYFLQMYNFYSEKCKEKHHFNEFILYLPLNRKILASLSMGLPFFINFANKLYSLLI